MEKVRLGTKYGGFYLPRSLKLDADSVVYCFGVGEDISFDITLAALYNCTVHMFDPTPRSIIHVDKIKEHKLDDNIKYGGGNITYSEYIRKFYNFTYKLKMHKYAIHNYDGKSKFYFPENPNHVSCTLEPEMMRNTIGYIDVEVKKITTIMSELGHDHIDLLKLDVEGVECEILLQLFENKIYPKYICVDHDALRKQIKKIMHDKLREKLVEKYNVFHVDGFDVTYILKN